MSLSELSLSDEAGGLVRRTGAPSGEKSSSVSLSDEEDEVLSFPAIICVICFLVGVSAYSGRRLEDGRYVEVRTGGGDAGAGAAAASRASTAATASALDATFFGLLRGDCGEARRPRRAAAT